jgi:pre-mRNA-splicing factor SPF27
MYSTELVRLDDSNHDSMEATQHRSDHHSHPIVFDALPYIDIVNEEYEQYALSLIEQEMKQLRNTNPDNQRLKPIPKLKLRTDTLQTSYQRCLTEKTKNQDRDHDMKDDQYSVAASPPPPPPLTEDNIAAWREAVKQSRIAYEKERMRSIQVETDKDDANGGLSSKVTSAAGLWKRYNSQVLEPQLASLQQLQQQEQLDVATINFRRQQSQQEQYQKSLHTLNVQYHELLQKQFTLKRAIADLENEISS